ncbi:hypothetical protein PUN28_000107 [Cardiocondyla obscurior]|uniref:Uncharacterized protein n=1 Tax=Cardiocondyla obscurior TaxID=286306 RepID=A0AAW2GXT7_9HYME
MYLTVKWRSYKWHQGDKIMTWLRRNNFLNSYRGEGKQIDIIGFFLVRLLLHSPYSPRDKARAVLLLQMRRGRLAGCKYTRPAWSNDRAPAFRTKMVPEAAAINRRRGY